MCRGLRYLHYPAMVQDTIKNYKIMGHFIMLQEEELRSILEDVVLKAMAKNADSKTAKMPSDVIGTEEAHELLLSLGYNISLATLRNKIYLKQVPSARCGGKRIFSRSALTAWVEANTLPSAKEKASLQMAKTAANQKA